MGGLRMGVPYLKIKFTNLSKETQLDPEDYTYPRRTKGPNDS